MISHGCLCARGRYRREALANPFLLGTVFGRPFTIQFQCSSDGTRCSALDLRLTGTTNFQTEAPTTSSCSRSDPTPAPLTGRPGAHSTRDRDRAVSL